MFGLAALLKTTLALSFPQTTSACLGLVYEYYEGEKKGSEFALCCLEYQAT